LFSRILQKHHINMLLPALSHISRGFLMAASCLGPMFCLAQFAPNPGVVQREQANRPAAPTGGGLKLSLPPEPDVAAEARPVLQLEGVRLLGNKVIPVADIQPLIDPLLGRKVSYAELRKVAAEIEALYRRRGYLLCRAVLPEQEVKDGVIALVVVEGYVGESQVGPGTAPKALAGQLERYVSPVLAQRPLRADLIERQLLLAEDLSGISLESVLSRGAVLGSSRLTVAAETRAREVTFGADNYLQRSLGEARAFLDVRLNEFEDAVRQWYFSASAA
jgi:hemolysin activation/secretion protein